jgi:protein-S-isoprenylcysteine O-methyltransferase Ste14
MIGILIAQWTLGSSFSITPQARQLVTRGIYSKIRNPIYISGTVFIAGLILIMGMPWLWVALVALVVVQIVRARKEARVLETKFGEEYRRYRDQTWF